MWKEHIAFMHFHCNNGKANAPQCYVTHTLPVLLYIVSVMSYFLCLCEGTALVFQRPRFPWLQLATNVTPAAALGSLRDLPNTRPPALLLYCAENGQCGLGSVAVGGLWRGSTSYTLQQLVAASQGGNPAVASSLSCCCSVSRGLVFHVSIATAGKQ